MENTQPIVPEIWGAAALAKRKTHYSHLRAGQLRKRAKKHLKLLKQLDEVQQRLLELKITNIGKDINFKARRAFEIDLYHTAFYLGLVMKKHTVEKQFELQQGYHVLPPAV